MVRKELKSANTKDSSESISILEPTLSDGDGVMGVSVTWGMV